MSVFSIEEKDVGRYVRCVSTGDIGRIKKDSGNGWLFPSLHYEWRGRQEDFEYVTVASDGESAATETEVALYSKGELGSPLEYALSIWKDTRGERITREEAAKTAEEMSDEGRRLPVASSADFVEGWEAACETVALALRFEEYHM